LRQWQHRLAGGAVYFTRLLKEITPRPCETRSENRVGLGAFLFRSHPDRHPPGRSAIERQDGNEDEGGEHSGGNRLVTGGCEEFAFLQKEWRKTGGAATMPQRENSRTVDIGYTPLGREGNLEIGG